MRMLLRLLLLAVAPVLVIVAPGAAPSHACSCVQASLDQQVKDADVVFVGTVLDEPSDSDGEVSFTVRVSSVYKGLATERVKITSPSEESACGIAVSKGDRWAFLTGDDFAATSCGGSAPVEQVTAADLERVVGPGGPPRPGGVPDPTADADDPVADVVTRVLVAIALVFAAGVAILLLLMLRAWARDGR